MANTVYESHTNEHILVKFLADLHAILDDRTVWGNHLGSETLIRRHKNTRFKKYEFWNLKLSTGFYTVGFIRKATIKGTMINR